jgi:hypothetical protein
LHPLRLVASRTPVRSAYALLRQVPETELLDLVDPHAKPKVFPGETCGKTRPASFHYVPATALWEQYRFGGYYLKTHKDISQVLMCCNLCSLPCVLVAVKCVLCFVKS